MAIEISQRLVLGIMCFLGVFNSYTMRTCLSFAITKMVKPKENVHHYSKMRDPLTPYDNFYSIQSRSKGIADYDTYDWTEGTQGMILGSFYWGYIITHIPGGILAEKFGGKYVFSGGLLAAGILTILTPMAVHLGGAPALILVRFMVGLGEGVTFPALSTLLSAWIPKSRRSIYCTFTLSGIQGGIVVGNLLSARFLSTFSGWQSVFYIFGGFACIWAVAFMFVCSDNPETHPFITDKEKDHLLKNIGRLSRDKNLPPTPWLQILRNVPSMVMVVAQFGHAWLLFLVITYLPKYMHDILNVSLKDNGLFSSIPYVVMWIVNVSSGHLCDFMYKQGFNLTFLRKLFACIASYPPAVFIVLVTYVGYNTTAVIVLFSLTMGCVGAWNAGVKVNTIDLSPNYSGSLMALVNGLGAISGAIAPPIAGLLTPHASLAEWRKVFWLSFVIVSVVTLGFGIYASAEIQSFDNPANHKKDTGDPVNDKKDTENPANDKEDTENED